jgi:glyoxylase-like metal-dependent hydrolase (beta-lactamase superfamily II)
MVQFRIISIGTLSSNPLWGESGPLRTPHATTVAIRSDDRIILVDPGLPPQVMQARLNERWGLSVDQVTDVFVTNFRPAHRAGIEAFKSAQWWIGEAEREAIGGDLLSRFDEEQDEEVREMLRHEITLLKRFKNAPDHLAPNVDLFPLPGFTPGTCGLLLTLPQTTVLLASDAIATIDHLEKGQILAGAYDLDQAGESFKEAIEIADWIVPGHDHLTVNPMQNRF